MKNLVAYFSWGGNTRKTAERIARFLNADLFEIKRAKPYSKNYGICAGAAKIEQSRNARPELEGNMPDLSNYDRVILGYPIWWYSCPMPILTFAQKAGLAGKTVLPFCTHGGSGPSKSTDDIRKACPQADVRECLNANDLTDADMSRWLGQ